MLATELRLTQTEENQVIRLMKHTHCPTDHSCLRKSPDEICKAQPIASGCFLECLEKNGGSCCRALNERATQVLCECPMRVYLNRRFGI
jgi:hypothetical protein